MNFKEAIKYTKSTSIALNDFELEILLDKKNFKLTGRFWKSGESTYAKFDNFSYTAGSFDTNPEKAKAKALFRLINLTESVLYEEDFSNIYDSNIAEYKKYLKEKKNIFPFNQSSEKIPVFEEKIVIDNEGNINIRLLLEKTINNIKELYSKSIDDFQTTEFQNYQVTKRKSVTGKEIFGINRKLVRIWSLQNEEYVCTFDYIIKIFNGILSFKKDLKITAKAILSSETKEAEKIKVLHYDYLINIFDKHLQLRYPIHGMMVSCMYDGRLKTPYITITNMIPYIDYIESNFPGKIEAILNRPYDGQPIKFISKLDLDFKVIDIPSIQIWEHTN